MLQWGKRHRWDCAGEGFFGVELDWYGNYIHRRWRYSLPRSFASGSWKVKHYEKWCRGREHLGHKTINHEPGWDKRIPMMMVAMSTMTSMENCGSSYWAKFDTSLNCCFLYLSHGCTVTGSLDFVWFILRGGLFPLLVSLLSLTFFLVRNLFISLLFYSYF